MKIISAQQSKALDLATIKNEPISSIDLMERAGKLISEEVFRRHGKDKKYNILCGNGNNGGDGLVIARLLSRKGCKVGVYIDIHNPHRSEENAANLARLNESEAIEIFDLFNFDISRITSPDMVWIDALFGVGLSRPLTGKWSALIEHMNAIKGVKISIDIPSGLLADILNQKQDIIFKADTTYTIGQPKLTFFLPETTMYVGDFMNIDIQLDQKYLNQLDSCYFYSSLEDIQAIYRPRVSVSHKGTYGHALLIAGSYGKMGAAILATQGALKVGAGLVSSYVPQCGYNLLQMAVPEAMCITDKQINHIYEFPNIQKYQSVGVGSGLGILDPTKDSLLHWLKTTDFSNKRVVLDADALNMLSQEKKALKNLPPQSILTPHLKEFERLTHLTSHSLERLALAQEFAHRYHCILVLKDAITSIIAPNKKVYFNTTGNAGLATGGSGDTLMGMITGILAQGYNPLDAARLGVWLHGKAADLGLQKESMESFTARDITTYLGMAFKVLKH